MNSEENRNIRRDKKRHNKRYAPIKHNGVGGFNKYEWTRRKREKQR